MGESIDQVAQSFVRQLTQAASEQKLVKKAHINTLTESVVRETSIARALVTIARDLDSRTYVSTGEKIAESDKEAILRKTSELLKLPKVVNFSRVIKEASIDSFSELVAEWDIFVSKL